MNQNEKIISAFRQDMELPAIVTQKADAAFAQILAEEQKETGKMKETKKKSHKKKMPLWAKSAAAVAAVLLLVIGVCSTNPVLAARIPVLGRIFSMLGKTAEYPGDYQEYVQPLEEPDQVPAKEGEAEADTPAYSQTVDGVTVTLSEIYCNQESLSISMLVESSEPFADKIMKWQDGSRRLSLEAVTEFSFRPLPYVGDKELEGDFLDEKTFAGIWRIGLDGVLADESEVAKILEEAEAAGGEIPSTDEEIMQYIKKLPLPETFTMEISLEKIVGDLAEAEPVDWGMSEEELAALPEEEFRELYSRVMEETGRDQYPNKAEYYWFEGPWHFTVPVTVNAADNHTVPVEDFNEAGVGLHSVTVTPFELSLELEEAGRDCIPIVFDAQGNWMEHGENTSVFPIADHDVSRITICICEFEKWKGDIIAHRDQDDYLQYTGEHALYRKELELPVSK